MVRLQTAWKFLTTPIPELLHKETTTEKIDKYKSLVNCLEQKQDAISNEIAELERKEIDKFTIGKSSTSAHEKKRVAREISNIRRECSTKTTMSSVISRQIEILRLQIHNLEIVRYTQESHLPVSDELTLTAVEAEELVDGMNEKFSLAQALSKSFEFSPSNEEEEILKEFETDTIKPEVIQPKINKISWKNLPEHCPEELRE